MASTQAPSGMTRMAARERRSAKLDMAPMIDCVFLLLIFFMVSTQFRTDAWHSCSITSSG